MTDKYTDEYDESADNKYDDTDSAYDIVDSADESEDDANNEDDATKDDKTKKTGGETSENLLLIHVVIFFYKFTVFFIFMHDLPVPFSCSIQNTFLKYHIGMSF